MEDSVTLWLERQEESFSNALRSTPSRLRTDIVLVCTLSPQALTLMGMALENVMTLPLSYTLFSCAYPHLATGEAMQTDHIKDRNLCFVTEILRIEVYTPTLPSVSSRGNLHTAMIPVRAVHLSIRSTIFELTEGR
jgi:hypothetical protein